MIAPLSFAADPPGIENGVLQALQKRREPWRPDRVEHGLRAGRDVGNERSGSRSWTASALQQETESRVIPSRPGRGSSLCFGPGHAHRCAAAGTLLSDPKFLKIKQIMRLRGKRIGV